MELREINTFSELDACFKEFSTFNGWIYRGQADATWALVPKLARVPFLQSLMRLRRKREALIALGFRDDGPGAELSRMPIDLAYLIEDRCLSTWRSSAAPYVRQTPKNDWEWLAIGQHHGLMTRLLDWTRNPLTATFFALSEASVAAPSAIYALRCPRALDAALVSRSQLQGVAVYDPPPTFDRIHRQSALFTVSGDPFQDISDILSEEVQLAKLVVSERSRETLLRRLVSFGVNRSILFPDLDGVAAHINWALNNPALLAKGTSSLQQLAMKLHEQSESAMDELIKSVEELINRVDD